VLDPLSKKLVKTITLRRLITGDPQSGRVETFFDPQKLHATGRNGPRRDRLSLFLLYRVWSQSGRNLKPC
jgi:hypothetical protein